MGDQCLGDAAPVNPAFAASVVVRVLVSGRGRLCADWWVFHESRGFPSLSDTGTHFHLAVNRGGISTFESLFSGLGTIQSGDPAHKLAGDYPADHHTHHLCQHLCVGESRSGQVVRAKSDPLGGMARRGDASCRGGGNSILLCCCGDHCGTASPRSFDERIETTAEFQTRSDQIPVLRGLSKYACHGDWPVFDLPRF